MKSDMEDRLKMLRKIQTFDSLNPNEHPDGLVNIITGSTAADKVNVDVGLYFKILSYPSKTPYWGKGQDYNYCD